MKLLKIIPLSFVLLLGACNANSTGSSSSGSQSIEPPTPSETSELDLFGFDLKKESDVATTATYNLADQINLHSGVKISDLMFTILQTENPVATINDAGLLTKVRYGSTQVNIKRKSTPFFDKNFTIHFFPSAEPYVGNFTAELTASTVTGHEDQRVTVNIETKADKTFKISYTAGYLMVGTEEPTEIQIESAIEAQGVYEYENILKFTVSTEAFPFTKTFGARLIFDGNNPIIDTRVPVSSSRTSNRTNFNKVVA